MERPVINIPELSERLDHDFELFIELAELFFDDSAALLNKIENAVNSGDAETLRKGAHTLKGAVSNFSAPGAYEAASALEQSGSSMELSHAPMQLELLKSEIAAVVEEMKSIISRGSF